MVRRMMYDVVVIGAGAGGLVCAIGAASAGKKVLLVEKGNWGGDCTNFGCIPSKALISGKTLDEVRETVREVRSHENPEALNALGVETLVQKAEFIDSKTLSGGIQGKQFVIATGSHPLVPQGMEGFHTNETIFDLKEVPKHLTVVGGGPIGCELAQAFKRHGAEVTLMHAHNALLPREEEMAQDLIKKQFESEGIELKLGERIKEVDAPGEVLVALGRRPNVEGLGLEKAGVDFSENGIEIDKYGRTSQKHIWAVGDVVGGPFFTHKAEHQARGVLKNLILPWNSKLPLDPIPRVTFTDPEVASVGVMEGQIYTLPLSQVDRAIAVSRTDGYIRVATKKWSGKILGATIVAPRAGEMLAQVLTAMYAGIPARKLSSILLPYPIFNQGVKKIGDLYLKELIQTLTKKLKRN